MARVLVPFRQPNGTLGSGFISSHGSIHGWQQVAGIRWFDSYRVIIQGLQISVAALFFMAASYSLT